MCVRLELEQLQSKIHGELAENSHSFDIERLKLVTTLFILIMHDSQKNQRSYAYWEKEQVRKLNREVKALYGDKVQLSLGVISGMMGIVGGALGCGSITYAPLSALSQGLSASSQGLQSINTAVHTPKEGEKMYEQTVLELQKRRLEEAKQNAQDDKNKEERMMEELKRTEELHHSEMTSIVKGQ